MKTYELIVHGPGGWYYLVPVVGGYRLAFDPNGRRIAAYGHIYPTAQSAKDAAYGFVSY